jgi:hypothetical protein
MKAYSKDLLKFFKDANHQFPILLKVLSIFLAIDIFFLFLHAYSLTLPVTEQSTLNLRLDMDGGYPESYNYLKYIMVGLFCIYFSIKRKMGIYLIWALFFLLLFADDAFTFHEKFGGRVVAYFDLPGFLTLRPQDLGAVIVIGTTGMIIALPILYTLIRGVEEAKRITLHFIVLTAILLFFGIFVDLLHSALRELPGSGILTVVEDLGEMLAASLMVWYAFYLHNVFKTDEKLATSYVGEVVK